MRPLIDKAKLLQELVESYDVEAGQQISAAKLYNLIRSQKEVEPVVGYWYPAMDENGWICSNCGGDVCYLQFEGQNERFCRYCGAMMINAEDFELQDKKDWRIK